MDGIWSCSSARCVSCAQSVWSTTDKRKNIGCPNDVLFSSNGLLSAQNSSRKNDKAWCASFYQTLEDPLNLKEFTMFEISDVIWLIWRPSNCDSTCRSSVGSWNEKRTFLPCVTFFLTLCSMGDNCTIVHLAWGATGKQILETYLSERERPVGERFPREPQSGGTYQLADFHVQIGWLPKHHVHIHSQLEAAVVYQVHQ